MGKESLQGAMAEGEVTFKRNVWIINPYGSLPSEGWRSTRTVLLARTLVECGFNVTWFLSAFSHIAKRTRPSEASPSEELGITLRFALTSST
jgi:hypothetical protein